MSLPTDQLLEVDGKPGTRLGLEKFRGLTVFTFDWMRTASCTIVGLPGMGKSSLVESMVFQDVSKSYGCIVLDPARDLIDNIVAELPVEALEKTYILDMSDEAFPFGVNVFALSRQEAQDVTLRQAALDRVLQVMLRLFPGEGRTLLEKQLRFITQLFFDNPGHSLADIPKLLYDDAFRSRLLRNCTNRHVLGYWEYEYNSLSLSKRQTATASLINRLASLLPNPMLENIIAQKTTTIDFRRSLDRGEIILIRLHVNEYEQIAPLIGTMLIAEISRAVFSFSDTELAKRKRFALYVDEFQNFSTKDFARLFTQARKYGLMMTVSNQYRDQLTEDTKFATSTADTMIAFRCISPDARELASTFQDRNAVITDRLIFPDVLKHLPDHPSERVQAFLGSHIQPLQQKAKEPIRQVPRYLTGIAT